MPSVAKFNRVKKYHRHIPMLVFLLLSKKAYKTSIGTKNQINCLKSENSLRSNNSDFLTTLLSDFFNENSLRRKVSPQREQNLLKTSLTNALYNFRFFFGHQCNYIMNPLFQGIFNFAGKQDRTAFFLRNHKNKWFVEPKHRRSWTHAC